MDKNVFENYKGLLFCESCNKMVPKAHMNHRRVKQNYIITKCNVDMWLDRHRDFVIPDNFNIDDIKYLLHCFLYNDSCILNDVAHNLNKELDAIVTLYELMNIRGKHIKIATKCNCCGKDMLINPHAYKINLNNYCSRTCYAKSKSEQYSGEGNPRYNRINTKCSNCGASISVIPYDYNKTNSYGDNHNFCSQQCYWAFRSKYYIQEKTYTYHHEYSEQEKETLRLSLLNRLSKEDRLNTKPQLAVNSFLEMLNVQFEREKIFGYYAVDNYIIQHNGIIEVMGDYWHSNPIIYNENKHINDIQRKQIHRDKLKISYIKNHYNIPILFLWENDIINDPDKCIQLIDLFIKSLDDKIELQNYHSFNWELKDVLTIKQNIIIPYQSLDIEEYRDLFILQNA